MEEYDLIVRNAHVVDGSGRPGFSGSVGVRGDRIAAVGTVEGRAAREIDAGGKVLAPGFIDIHTHYDPQLCWDRLATPSPEHGVTTLVIGNCSISMAPVKPAHTQKLIHLFGSVEDMEGRLLESTVPFEWETVPEYFAYLRQGLGPNVGALIGHSVLRYYVMGTDAQKRAATPEEIRAMAGLLKEAMSNGALGFSVTYTHLDENGDLLPCQYAEREEMLGLMQAMAELGRGVVEVSPTPLPGSGEKLNDRIDMFGGLALETGVTCTLSPVLQIPATPNLWRETIARFEAWREKGAPIFAQTQTRPLDMTIRLDQGSPILGKGATWRAIMDKTPADRMVDLADPSLRDNLYKEAMDIGTVFQSFIVRKVISEENRQYLGRSLMELSAETGRRFTDLMIDISLADNLEAEFELANYIHADPESVLALLDNPAVHIGSGDAGAHITSFAGAGDTCYLFERFVRGEKTMTLERAVQRLTGDIARDWKITDRGEIAPGKFADLVLFDPDTIARGEEIWVDDVPGGNGRYVRHPEGVEKVFVNGKLLVDAGSYTGEMPGRLV